ncbi:MAG: thiamine pyrophosphate-dependent enzyme [Thermodesulfobacteriota bacterium]
MNMIVSNKTGETALFMGNEAIARGALEAGVSICAAYPGNPSSDIIKALAEVGPEMGIHVEWSVNEKVALEVAASAAMTGLRGLAAMKQNGLNVASDFLLNLNLSGIRGGLVLVVCDDPGGISSTNEQDSRLFAKMGELPLFEPSTFQEAKDMVVEAFELSEKLELPCLVRSVTRLSHARGNVELGSLSTNEVKPFFDRSKPFINIPSPTNAHKGLRQKFSKCREIFENSPYNYYSGPENPELMLVTSGAGLFYSQDAVRCLDVSKRTGILKVGTTSPLPEQFLSKHLIKTQTIIFVEDGGPFLEGNIRELCAGRPEFSNTKFLGKLTEDLPPVGELTPDLIIDLLCKKLDIEFIPRSAEYSEAVKAAVQNNTPERGSGFCAGCPHRATYWAIKKALIRDGRDGFVLGDIGCYGMGAGPAGYQQMNTMQAMGSGVGIASGMGLLEQFGLDQPVIAVCGDSTFYHGAIPALLNANQHGSNFLLLILDNDATAMTGFQPHPGLGKDAMGRQVPSVKIADICRAIGLEPEIQDPYDLDTTIKTIIRLLREKQGAKVLILKRECALVAVKSKAPAFSISVDAEKCLGDDCGCNRFCTRTFRCPGLIWDAEKKQAQIDQAVCTGCGVCTQICQHQAIISEAS